MIITFMDGSVLKCTEIKIVGGGLHCDDFYTFDMADVESIHEDEQAQRSDDGYYEVYALSKWGDAYTMEQIGELTNWERGAINTADEAATRFSKEQDENTPHRVEWVEVVKFADAGTVYKKEVK